MCNEGGSETGNNLKWAGLISWASLEVACNRLSALLLCDILGKLLPALTSQLSPRRGTLAYALLQRCLFRDIGSSHCCETQVTPEVRMLFLTLISGAIIVGTITNQALLSRPRNMAHCGVTTDVPMTVSVIGT